MSFWEVYTSNFWAWAGITYGAALVLNRAVAMVRAWRGLPEEQE